MDEYDRVSQLRPANENWDQSNRCFGVTAYSQLFGVGADAHVGNTSGGKY